MYDKDEKDIDISKLLFFWYVQSFFYNWISSIQSKNIARM